MIKFQAIRISAEGRRWSRERKNIRVLQVFPHSCNLVDEYGNLLTLLMCGFEMRPFSVEVAPEVENQIVFTDLVDQHTTVRYEMGSLSVGPLEISWTSAGDWDAVIPWRNYKGDPSGLDQLIDGIFRLLVAAAPEGSLASIIQFPKESGPIGRPPAWLQETVSIRSRERVSALLSAIQSADMPGARHAARNLAGLGSGLTPAGDDFILGLIYALWLCWPSETAQSWAESLVEAAVPLTTPLSGAFLNAGARGEASEHWHELFQSWRSNNPTGVERALGRIIQTGHSSGSDALAGFYATVRLLTGRFVVDLAREVQ
jgi:Protein of unknown function (DUF2877)